MESRTALKNLAHKRNLTEILSEIEVNKANTGKKMKAIQSEHLKDNLSCDTDLQATLFQSRSSLTDVSNDCDVLSVQNENMISGCESTQNCCTTSTSVSVDVSTEKFSRPCVAYKDKAI